MFLEDPTKKIKVAFSSSRSKRPHRPTQCPFCKGSEHVTPPTTFALPASDWKVRCFRNAFPIVYGRDGDHEVIVETPVHSELFEDLSPEQLALVFQAYQDRFKALSSRKNAKYVLLFKNFGVGSGASIPHEHSQVLSFPFVPEMIQSEAKSGKTLDGLLKQPALLENRFFKAVCPPFSRFAHEAWIAAKDPGRRFENFSGDEGAALLSMLQQIVRKSKKFAPDYTVAYHAAPPGKKMRFHAEIYPRKAVWGGVELGAGVIVNFKPAAKALRELKQA